MNNLHRELAPISDAAWAQIEEEAARTFKRHLAGRRVIDVIGPSGFATSAVGTGHIRPLDPPGTGIKANQRDVQAMVEFRVPFDLDRQAIDDVERGANDSDWQPVKDAAKELAFAEDRAIFEGYAAGGIGGVHAALSNPALTLPADVRRYPEVIAKALTELRLEGVDGPYVLLLGAEAYTKLSSGADNGEPVFDRVARMVKDQVLWAPALALAGGYVLSARGGDFEMHIGQDVSIGYLSHTDSKVTLYLQETFTFLMLTAEAGVALRPPEIMASAPA
ncbi:family 1 encapsulin nanocompartment shell protein [Rhodopila sp.]|jgi:uncharacterized linocin/CFP29 family protein|uniref:family 1 encapsulin nanocompartment shell protein n=1 Tax=Rhodopila sp. TaxID=2480087 RepID=UPI002C006AFB|nr:family 1 encapsulin nanocompartment shell protein [Rhodopila sp.]HVZ10559.1 family 1 encapsulin nanocompartment shell protein [Rhodopila sp.]